jgi:ceramide glucosyltransferase
MVPALLRSRRGGKRVLYGLSLAVLAAVHGFIALAATAASFRRSQVRPENRDRLPVSVLKPLCGAEPRSYENLRSFCVQDYPDFQLVCGVRDANDPAIAVVRRLQQEFPALNLDLVIDRRLHGGNYKVSNLINILPRCRHDRLVLADSDICVAPNYLAEVVAPLTDPSVGVVTCLYGGRAASGVWSRLGVLFIDDWFAPSVRVAHLFGSQAFAFGATIALRRETLTAIGGFEAVADQLADDYRLGELTRRLGLRTELSRHCVTTDIVEGDPKSLFEREVRWLRTIQSIQPLGFAFCFVTFSLPLALAGVLLAPEASAAKVSLGVTLAARLALHVIQRKRAGGNVLSEIWLLVPRDFLNLVLWGASFASRRVRWGQRWFLAGRKGVVCEIEARSPVLT